jgi:hypothetical protein
MGLYSVGYSYCSINLEKWYKLLLERLALAAIARVTGVSERWLQLYVNQKFYETPKVIEVTKKK